jgi:hypothetical protein
MSSAANKQYQVSKNQSRSKSAIQGKHVNRFHALQRMMELQVRRLGNGEET